MGRILVIYSAGQVAAQSSDWAHSQSTSVRPTYIHFCQSCRTRKKYIYVSVASVCRLLANYRRVAYFIIVRVRVVTVYLWRVTLSVAPPPRSRSCFQNDAGGLHGPPGRLLAFLRPDGRFADQRDNAEAERDLRGDWSRCERHIPEGAAPRPYCLAPCPIYIAPCANKKL